MYVRKSWRGLVKDFLRPSDHSVGRWKFFQGIRHVMDLRGVRMPALRVIESLTMPEAFACITRTGMPALRTLCSRTCKAPLSTTPWLPFGTLTFTSSTLWLNPWIVFDAKGKVFHSIDMLQVTNTKWSEFTATDISIYSHQLQLLLEIIYLDHSNFFSPQGVRRQILLLSLILLEFLYFALCHVHFLNYLTFLPQWRLCTCLPD